MLKVGATYFYNDIDDMIVAAPPSFQNINVENVVTNGVETFVAISPIGNLMTRLHYTYTDTEARKAASFGISEGSRLLRRPLHNFSGDISYRFLKDRAQGTLTIFYVGERADIDPITFATVTADDYVVVNLPVSFKLRDDMEIFGRIENLFDRDYQEVLGFNAPGISAYGGVKISF
jgi:vitamin B12 transporter